MKYLKLISETSNPNRGVSYEIQEMININVLRIYIANLHMKQCISLSYCRSLLKYNYTFDAVNISFFIFALGLWLLIEIPDMMKAVSIRLGNQQQTEDQYDQLYVSIALVHLLLDQFLSFEFNVSAIRKLQPVLMLCYLSIST
ncbi:hypothetical protein QVD17_13137 [Tagetes erecta]|uniref:Uncharacterized protein n=1 Tax=Tagetes erecta TaxID=13708 RepID=A0AAD8KWR3_TARER|nr:hypothetical protein QVD17_13137 [Tagetes erecta]